MKRGVKYYIVGKIMPGFLKSTCTWNACEEDKINGEERSSAHHMPCPGIWALVALKAWNANEIKASLKFFIIVYLWEPQSHETSHQTLASHVSLHQRAWKATTIGRAWFLYIPTRRNAETWAVQLPAWIASSPTYEIINGRAARVFLK